MAGKGDAVMVGLGNILDETAKQMRRLTSPFPSPRPKYH